ncbi:MAG: hypothetical protein A3E07_01745 [Candidatus Wildermuthbacteria bacterium RIFCSPHIGHO2_12_FULL_45_9]|nr:MAG: hypothetical protein A3E07_01745 [Candidatus Wildermuthbacteria bacterium RIFCSPHIGHO2_12_FULL_45_9]
MKQSASCAICHDSRDANVCGLGFGRCMEFNGTITNNEYLTVASNDKIDNIFYGAATITAWVKPTSSTDTVFPIVAKVSGSPSLRGYLFNIYKPSAEPHGQVQFAIYTADTHDTVSSFNSSTWQTPANSVLIGEWSHVAVVFDGKNTRNNPALYINGVRQQVDLFYGSVNPLPASKNESGVPISIGKYKFTVIVGGISYTPEQWATGFIDEVAVYGVGMQAGEIQQLYAQGRENHLANE